MILPDFKDLLELGLPTLASALFVLLSLAMEAGYLLGRHMVVRRSATSDEASGISTLTAGMLGLLAFTLSLSIGFAQSRYEARRDLVLAEANAIGTAWLRTKLIDGDEGPAIAAKIEDYARVRLDFTIAASDSEVPALVVRGNVLQDDIWRIMRVVAHRSPNPVTTSLVTALNEMFDLSLSQRFAYASGVPEALMVGLYAGAVLAIGALGYQFGVAGKRQVILSSLLLLMWSGGMVLILDLSQPRAGKISVDAEPLTWTIQGFGQQ